MKNSKSGKLKARRGPYLELRVNQKQSLRYVPLAISLFAVLLGVFAYFNFYSVTTRAESVQPKYRPTYTTTDINVPVRLLIKSEKVNTKDTNSKNNISTVSSIKKEGRGQIIADEILLSE